jgi:hypothetical protein
MRRFYLHTRHGIFYAELIDPETGRKLTPRSTGATERDAALLTVAGWLEHGVPMGRTRKTRPAADSFGRAEILSSIRKREVPLLPTVRDAIRALGEENPHGTSDERFVFYGILADKPLDAKVLGNGFTEALHAIGIDEQARRSRGLVFHSLRHCFATALADRIDQRQAMKATGHRTSVVFESYANHESENDLASICKASEDAFGKVLAFAAKKGA